MQGEPIGETEGGPEVLYGLLDRTPRILFPLPAIVRQEVLLEGLGRRHGRIPLVRRLPEGPSVLVLGM